jgi:hypothetical protein
VVQAQVLAFLSSRQASREANREARVREEQKERKMSEMFYSERRFKRYPEFWRRL